MHADRGGPQNGPRRMLHVRTASASIAPSTERVPLSSDPNAPRYHPLPPGKAQSTSWYQQFTRTYIAPKPSIMRNKGYGRPRSSVAPAAPADASRIMFYERSRITKKMAKRVRFPVYGLFRLIGYRSVQRPCLTDGIGHLHEVYCLSSLHLIHGKSDKLPLELRSPPLQSTSIRTG